MLTLPIWGSLWLIGKIFDIDSLVEIGEVCEHILVAGGSEKSSTLLEVNPSRPFFLLFNNISKCPIKI